MEGDMEGLHSPPHLNFHIFSLQPFHILVFFVVLTGDRCLKEGCGLIAMATTWLHRILLLSSVYTTTPAL